MRKIGDKVRMTADAVENYGEEWRDKELTISHVARNKEQHRGYDDTMQGMALYDFEGVGFSLYEYEVKGV